MSADKIMKTVQNDKKFKICLEKVSDKVSNQILLTNEKQNFVLEQQPIQNNVFSYDFTSNLSNLQKENLNSESLLKEIDKIHANKIDLQRKDKDSNKDINYERITVVGLETTQDVSKDNLFLNECSKNENIVLSHTVASPKITEEKDDITHTAKKNSYKNIDLTTKKCTVTDQNNDNNNNVKRRKLNENFTSRSHNENVENTSKYLNEKKQEVETCRIINEKICNSSQSVQLRESTLAEMNRSSMENQFLLDEENLDKEIDDDCLSLFADPTLMQE